MTDKRELILQRLLEIGASIPGIVYACRNELLNDEDNRPAFQVIDADESADDRDPPQSARAFSGNAPVRVGMTPELYITLAGYPENVGTALNVLRAAAVKAILSDTTLRALVGVNGGIKYEGCATGLSRGREMTAEAGISFTFTYVLKVSDL